MLRLLFATLRGLATLLAALVVYSTVKVLAGSDATGFGIVAGLAAAALVHVAAGRPPPRPWLVPQEVAAEPDAEEPPAGA